MSDKTDVKKECAGVFSGAALPVAVVVVAGETGVSAVGITTAIAALGLGSMLAGVAVLGLIGVGAYVGTKKVYEELFDGA